MGNFLGSLFGIKQPSPPKVPQPTQVADTQQQFNAQQAASQAQYNLDALRANLSANRLDQSTPFMNISYHQTGTDQYGNPTYGVNTQYSPEQQALLDLLQGNQQQFGQVGQGLIQSISTDPRFSGGVPDFTNMASPIMQRQLAIMNPYYKQQSDNLDTQLRNQGLIPGTPGYDRAMRTLQQTQNESMGQFANQSIGTVMSEYQQPFDIIRGIMGSTGPVSMPNLGQQTPSTQTLATPTVGSVNYAGIQNDILNALNTQYQQQMSQYTGGLSALTGILGTTLAAPKGSVLNSAVTGAGSGLARLMGLA